MARILDETNMFPELIILKNKLLVNLEEQSKVWHRTSSKKVSAGVFIKRKNDYIVAQNIGLSLVTGSLCAERALVAAVVSKYPDISFTDFEWILVMGESGPLVPCGVCAEWLLKINPNMKLYMVKGDSFIEYGLKELLREESYFEDYE